jgi:glycosyltransferase involved in cell wall biosynthesis
MDNNNILINTPFISSPAGVSNHYLGLRPYLPNNVIYNQYLTFDMIKDKVKYSVLYIPIRLLTIFYDIIKFIALIIYYRFPLIILNPSFRLNSIKRDAIYMKIAKIFGCKVVVFFHGWDNNYLKSILNGDTSINSVFHTADAYFVLGSEFRMYLERMGVSSPIFITSTKVDDRMIEEGNIEIINSKIKNILFLARIEYEKGIDIVIDAFSILLEEYPDLELSIVGSGERLEIVKSKVKNKNIPNITFKGALYGKILINEYKNADIYVLPTYGEGMPTTVLEAMAFGLPVITRPVGGLVDFFENGKMGFMTESLNYKDYVELIKRLIDNPEFSKNISMYNSEYAKNHFLASKIAKDMVEKIKAI